MKKMTFYIMILGILSSLFSCGDFSWKTFKEGDYKGMKYKVQSKETRGFTRNSISYRVKLGNLSPINLDAENTDWSAPYSTIIYGKTPFYFITDKDTAYVIEQKDPEQWTAFPLKPNNTMLYLFSDKSDESNQKYYEFFRDEWKKIDKQILKDKESINDFPNIIGVVFNEREKFVKQYKGKYLNQNYEITINPDGRIILESQDGAQTLGGLSQKIQMPGKRIFLEKQGLTMNELQKFVDKNGISITKEFEIIQK